MDFNARLGASKMSPIKHRHAQINRCGINCRESAMKAKLFNNTLFLCKGDHVESKVFKDMVISDFISSRQGCLVYWSFAKSEMVRSFSMCNGDVCKFPKAPASKGLTKHQNQQLAPVRKSPSMGSFIILCDQSSEVSLWQVGGKLRENIVSCMHNCANLNLAAKISISNVGHTFSHIKSCA